MAEKLNSYTPYNYCVNSPINGIDPDGMLSKSFMDDIWNQSGEVETQWQNKGNGNFAGSNGKSVGEEQGDDKKKNAGEPVPPNVNLLKGGVNNNGNDGPGLDNVSNNIASFGMGLSGVEGVANSSANYTPQYVYRGMAQAEAASAKLLGKIATSAKVLGVGASVITTTYSGYKVFNQIQTGGIDNVKGWDVTDTGVGILGVGATGLTYFGIISNPVGWTIGTGVLLYSGARLGYELYKSKP